MATAPLPEKFHPKRSFKSTMATAPLPEKFHPKRSFKFPKRKFGKVSEERSFRAEWYLKYTMMLLEIWPFLIPV